MNRLKNGLLFGGILFLFLGCLNSDYSTTKKEITENNNVQHAKMALSSPYIPKTFTFANEEVPLNDRDIRERFDRELTVNTFWRARTSLTLKRAHRWMPIIRSILKEEGVPQDLAYIPVAESAFLRISSPVGARGFWQIMEDSGKELGLEINREVDERLNIRKSTRAACKYLKKAYHELGSWINAVASYNMGVSGYKQQVKEQGFNSFFNLSLNDQTMRYVFRVFALKLILENPQRYGFSIHPNDLYPPYKTKKIKIDSTVSSVEKWSLNHHISLKIFRILNPWIRRHSLTVKKGKEYFFRIPKGDKQLQVFKGYN